MHADLQTNPGRARETNTGPCTEASRWQSKHRDNLTNQWNRKSDKNENPALVQKIRHMPLAYSRKKSSGAARKCVVAAGEEEDRGSS
jgi:hypothetical protein